MLSQLNSRDLLTLMATVLAHGTALMLLTWFASATLLRRCRPSIQSAVWTVVLIKFLLPPVLPFNFGLSGMLDSIFSHTELALQTSPQQVSPNRQIDGSMSVEPQGNNDSPQQGLRRSIYVGRLTDLVLFAYASLLLLLVTKALFYSYCAGRRLRRLPLADGIFKDEVAALAQRLGIRRLPQVRVDEQAASPFLIGAWSPTLVMPATLPAGVRETAREALLIHELAHIRRGDVLVRWLQNVARLIFFFWPPVWWLCRRLERYSEMACDQWAIKFSSVSPRLYAESLLEVAKGVRAHALTKQEVGFAPRQTRLMGARFKMILEDVQVKSPRLSWQVCAVLVGWGSFALTGSIFAESERDPHVAPVVAEAHTIGQLSSQSGLGAQIAATSARSSEVQESRQERKRIEERQALTRPPASDGQSVENEKLKRETLAAQERDLAQRAPALDLNGDGTISDFEAGYSVGLAYKKREGASPHSVRGLEEFKVRRDLRRVAPDWRKLGVELELQQRKSTSDGLPLSNH